MAKTAAAILALALALPAAAQEVAEPKTGVKFAARLDDMSLLGVGLRTRTILKVKVYAIGLYVADSALRGSLSTHKGKTGTPAFYRDVVSGDFGKQLVLKFVRDVSTDQIQGAFRDSLTGVDKAKVESFVKYFTDTKVGQEYVLRWAGGVLQTTVKGESKPPIADKDFAAAVFGIWLGEKPIQEDIKKDLASRAPQVLG